MRGQSSKRTLEVQAKPLTAFQPGSWPGTKPKPHGREGGGRRAQEGTEEGEKEKGAKRQARGRERGGRCSQGTRQSWGPACPAPWFTPTPMLASVGPRGPASSQSDQWVGLAWGRGCPSCADGTEVSPHTISWARDHPPVPAVIQGYSGPHLLGMIGGLGRAQGPVQCRVSASCSLVSVCDPHAHPETHQAGIWSPFYG